MVIFVIALCLRFLYFPDNIYFGFDQARDAFISKEILEGQFKIVGPTTSIPGLNHGAFFYYLFAPIYFLSQGDPTGLSIFLKIYNGAGVFLIFFIAKYLFGAKNSAIGNFAGIASALLFAFSYEQTQYSLFMTHPALAVISVLVFYLGLAAFLFKGNQYGLVAALLGLGFSFQFHFLLAYLGLAFILNLAIFYRRIPKVNLSTVAFAILGLTFSVSTFVIAEIKFKFSGVNNFLQSVLSFSQASGNSNSGGLNGVVAAAKRYTHDNILALPEFQIIVLVGLLTLTLFYLRQKEHRSEIIFLLIWFVVGLFSYFINDTSLYFYGIGTSISLLIFAGFLISQISMRSKILAGVLTLIIIASNLYLITANNFSGPNKEINVQTGMLLKNEKAAIDYIYSKALDDDFAVNAFSMPLNIKTTWSYLFEWYGKKTYGRVPVWGGDAAHGYPGNLEVNSSRSTLPYKRFLIVEPIRGIEDKLKDFLINEGWFTDTIEEKKFGDITVYYQRPK